MNILMLHRKSQVATESLVKIQLFPYDPEDCAMAGVCPDSR